MKKIMLIMTALAVYTAASGQEAQQLFFPEGTTWVEKTTNIIENTYRYDTYLVGGDTVIGGETYRKLSRNGVATGQYLREAGNKVYAHDASFGREFLLYDFDWSLGKELVFEYAEPDVEPMKIEISEIGQMRLSDGSLCDYVGNVDGDFLLRGMFQRRGVYARLYATTNGDRKTLYSFTRDGKLLYQYKADAFDCEEAYWVSDFYPDELPMQVSMFIFHSKGDTVYDGEVWQKVYGCEVTQDDFRTLRLELDTYDYSLFGLTRKDGDKVYGVVLSDYFADYHGGYFNDGEPFLLYDFGEERGTEITYPGALWPYTEENVTMQVSGNSEEVYYGVTRRVYSCSLYPCVEGVGESEYLGPFGVLFPVSTGQNPSLRSCIVDGKTIFGEEDVVPLCALKYYYDPFIAQVGEASSTWTVGRVEDGKVTSTYTVVRGGSYWNSIWECSAIQSFESFDIEKRATDLATITIDGETRTLYDFSLDEGEVFDNGVMRLEVTEVDTAYFEGYERRVLTMDSGEQWIDGIGSTRGLLAPVTEPTEEYEEVLLSCRSGDVVMYVNPVYGSGIDEQHAATATAYVSDGVLHVTATSAGGHTVSVVAMDGTEVLRTAFTGTSLSLQLPDLPHGVYVIIVADGDEVAYRAKVVI